LVAYLSDKVIRSADEAFDEKGYTCDIFEAGKKTIFANLPERKIS
jgi:hypothetical protein